MYDRLFPTNHENRISRGVMQQEIRIEFDLSIARSSFFYRGSRIWSALPLEAKNTDSVRVFKRMAKQWITENIKIVP